MIDTDVTGTAPGRAAVVSFVAADHRSGRTSVVANVAWSLAARGNRVLILDWDLRGTRIHEYLRPFLVDEALDDEVISRLGADLTRAITTAFGAAAEFRHYLPGGLAAVPRLDVVVPAPGRPPGGPDELARFTRLRAYLTSSEYDYVLLDGQPGETGTVVRDALIADRVVLCFASQDNAAREAAGLAVAVARDSPLGARILAVPSYLDTEFPLAPEEQAEQCGAVIRTALRAGNVRVGDETVRVVPVPFRTPDAVLVPVVYAPDDEPEVLAAYRALVEAVSDGAVTELAPTSERLRDQYRDYLRRHTGAQSGDSKPIEILYCSLDRPWADWAAGQLRAAGLNAQLHCVETGLRTVSPGSVVVAGRGRPLDGAGLTAGQMAELVLLRVTDEAVPVPGVPDVDLTGCSHAQARLRLLATLATSGELPPGGTGRLPSDRPAGVVGLPSQDPGTVHRVRETEQLRDLLPSGVPARAWLSGPPAAGRTGLAVAYASEFGYEYSLIWHVPAHDRPSAKASLSRLAERIGVLIDDEDRPTAVLQQVAAGYQPSLLIYDDVSDPATVEGLLPEPGTGHVLLVRDAGGAPDESVEVGPLTRDEARELLRDNLGEHSAGRLDALLDAVGAQPLNLRLTIGCIRAATGLLRARGLHGTEAAEKAAQLFLSALTAREPGKQRTDRLRSVAGSFLSLLDSYPGGRLVAAFALMCAHLAPDGVSLRLLRSTPFLTGLISAAGESADDLAGDATEIEVVMHSGQRFELFRIDRVGEPRLRMHPIMQQALLAVAGPERAERARRLTMQALAAWAPNDAEFLAGDREPDLREIGRHVLGLGALDELDSTPVRRLLVLHLAMLAKDGRPDQLRAGLAVAEHLQRTWPDRTDPLVRRLAVHHADLLRSLGDNAGSLAVDVAAHGEEPEQPARLQLRAAVNRRGVAGDLRGIGAFDRALTEDRATYRAMRAMLGQEHEQTLRTRHNLALSNYFAGFQEGARNLETETFRIRRGLSENDFLTWWCAIDLAVYQRATGDFAGARRLLAEAETRLTNLRGAGDPLTIRAKAALAVTERRLGKYPEARLRSGQALAAYQRTAGEQSLVTQGARLSLAVDLSYTGDMPAALAAAETALAAIRGLLLPDHPFVAVAEMTAAGLFRRAGRTMPALETAGEAVRLLADRLRPGHPWLIAARINQANALLDSGERDQAAAVLGEAAEAAELLPEGHPYLAILQNNSMVLDGGNGSPVDVDVEIEST
ncbi:FxSxx-COOH system tetratricopeptide repeat protein [Actinoplanes couchii]|uniref:Uncharacterized protein n=1 Tax=Actinoplanes couchii TaxID=403638 RepID=A0ABQ3X0C4_9ACTN|nr:FxSxx-COOH system tetratricopeptide repeat protein [Actinoplanes couchii]MDR6316229.1 MinD-like ATPase involved in chromosome partitioning or flagellar assembly/tetratricopeptide (TPR) repeat protein [Actinoplanes couchii]GID51843.1 hypothetical protein Aco03nite_002470 [Actinoplanes couchii]